MVVFAMLLFGGMLNGEEALALEEPRRLPGIEWATPRAETVSITWVDVKPVPPSPQPKPEAVVIAWVDPPKVETKTTEQQRRDRYNAAYHQAEREGWADYDSDGQEGSRLPEGQYRLWLHNGDVMFEKRRSVPKPDARLQLEWEYFNGTS